MRSFVHAALRIAHPHNHFEPLAHNGLIARCHRDWPADPDFLARWTTLANTDPAATVFNSPIWQTALVDEFVPSGTFRLITVERDRELLAVLPLALNTCSILETPGHWLTDYLEPLVDSRFAAESWNIVLRLLDHLWDWSITAVKLHHIRADSPLRQILPPLATEHRFEYTEIPVAGNPFIPLPNSWDKYLATLDPHERKEIKRKLRNVQAKANVKRFTLTHPDQIAPALDRAISAMRQSDSLKANFTDKVLGNFLRRTCPKLAQNRQLYIQELHLNGSPAAWLLCLPSPHGPMIYNTSYDHAHRHQSPGIVAFALSIQDAIAAGAPTYNLLRGDEQYKHRLGAKTIDLVTIQLLPS